MESTQEQGPDVGDYREWYEKYMSTDSDILGEDNILVQAVIDDKLDTSLVEQLIRDSTPPTLLDAVFCAGCSYILDNWPTGGVVSDAIRSFETDTNDSSRPGTKSHRQLNLYQDLEQSSDTDPRASSREIWGYTVINSQSTFRLEGKARSGCRFCGFILERLRETCLLDTFRKIEIRLIDFHAPQECAFTVQDWFTGPSQLLWLNLSGKECTQSDFGIASSVKFQSFALPPSAECHEKPREVLEIARDWLSNCCENHVACGTYFQGDNSGSEHDEDDNDSEGGEGDSGSEDEGGDSGSEDQEDVSSGEGFGSDDHASVYPLEYPPTRLVSIIDEYSRLVLTTDMAKITRYATLSHCWGDHKFIKLTLADIHAFKEKIPVEDLPKTFRDAIQVAKHLGLDYLWIDSLCIVQDDVNDWKKESAMMRSVYGCSTINIAASSARDGTEGCFLKPAGFIGGFRARTTEAGRQIVREFRTIDYEQSTIHTPLGRRAWALQERMLASRTIYFGVRGAYWECRSWIASEHLPEGYPTTLARPLVSRHWNEIVGLYSALDLTYSKDKLPAIAGIAKQECTDSKDEYLAGLWRSRILEQLCWSISTAEPLEKRLSGGAPTWTWTWASVEGRVDWYPIQEGVLQMTHAHLVDASTTIDGVDSFGQVSGGVVRLACSTMASGWVCRLEESKEMRAKVLAVGLTGGENRDFFIEIDTLTDLISLEATSIYLLPILSGETGAGLLLDKDADWINEKLIEGIVLRTTGGRRGEFTRMGSFKFYKDPISDTREVDSKPGKPRLNQSMDEFLKVLGVHGEATAEAACAEVIYSPEHPDQRFVITII